MTRAEWIVVSPVDGARVIEMAYSAEEAERRARKRPGFDIDGRLTVYYNGTPAPARVRAGIARRHTQAFLQAHKDWKREDTI